MLLSRRLLKKQAGGASNPVATLTDSGGSDVNNLSTYTFSVNAGTGGFVIVVFEGREANASDAVSVSSVTIGGNTASVLSSPASTANNPFVGMAYVGGVASGTVTVVVTLSDTANELRWGAYNITGLTSETPHSTNVKTGGPAASDTVTINIPDGGCQVACCAWGFSEAGANIAWTNLTEDYDVGSVNTQFSYGHDNSMSAETGRVLTATASSGTPGEEVDYYGIIGASWL